MSNRDFNIQEIARLAGVSKATVSRVLNNKPDVSAKTREKVEKVINKYNYTPNARALAFSQQKNMTVGLVFTHNEAETLSNPYYAELIQGILKKARETGYHIILSYFLEDDCFRLVRQKAVDGLLILTPDSGLKEKLTQLQKTKIPLVSTARIPGMENIHYVAVDEYNAAIKIMEHLIYLGHKKIAYISGPYGLYSSQARLQGYLEALKRHDIPYDPELVTNGDTSIMSGTEAMKTLLNKKKKVTAVFAGSDMMAIGVKRALEEEGLSVPGDVSLVSTDATDIAACLEFPLTTTKQPTRLRGELAMEMLVDLIEGREVKRNIMLPMDIEIRRTTGINL